MKFLGPGTEWKPKIFILTLLLINNDEAMCQFLVLLHDWNTQKTNF